MGAVTSCCIQNRANTEERVPFKMNRGNSSGIIVDSKTLDDNQADDFYIDSEIQKFLENVSSDSCDNLGSDAIEKAMLLED